MLSNISSSDPIILYSLSPVQIMACRLFWTKGVLLLIRPLGTSLRESLIKTKQVFIYENSFENVAGKTVAILSRPQCVNGNDILRLLAAWCVHIHYCDVIMTTMASQITSLAIVSSTVYPGADERKHQSSVSLAFVRGINRWPANSSHKGPVTRKMFPFDDAIMLKNSLYL